MHFPPGSSGLRGGWEITGRQQKAESRWALLCDLATGRSHNQVELRKEGGSPRWPPGGHREAGTGKEAWPGKEAWLWNGRSLWRSADAL